MNLQRTLFVFTGWLFFLSFALGLSAPAALALTLTVDSATGAVQATGATADGDVILLAVQRQRHLHWSEVTRLDFRETADSSGDLTLMPTEGVTWASAWIAVDLASGDHAVASPADYPLRQLGGTAAAASVSGTSVTLAVSAAEVVVVRPGVGHWTARLRDGGGGDSGSAHDGMIQLILADLTSDPQESAPVPTSFSAGDIIAGVDPQRMEVFVQEVTP